MATVVDAGTLVTYFVIIIYFRWSILRFYFPFYSISLVLFHFRFLFICFSIEWFDVWNSNQYNIIADLKRKEKTVWNHNTEMAQNADKRLVNGKK